MVSSLYTTLRQSIIDLAAANETKRAAESVALTDPPPAVLPALPLEALKQDVGSVWQSAWAEYAGSQSSDGKEKVDIVRSVMDLVGRDLVVSPISRGELVEPLDDASSVDKCVFQTRVQDRLDIALTLFEVIHEAIPGSTVLEPGAVFIPVLEDLVELISVDSWRTLWGYVETRSKRFTKDMPASRGKALPLLRTINAFLRFLSRTPADLVFRGRVHQFASSVISVADKSAINMRGDYNDIRTTWEEADETSTITHGDEPPNADVGDADIKMEDTKEEDRVVEKTEKGFDFYSTLWSLQQYFASPPNLDGPSVGDPPVSPFSRFKTQTDLVLPKLFEQTRREKDLQGKETEIVGQKRKRGGEEEFFHPRYLTGKRLFEHELADPSFRRQILVQYFILFQFLLNLVPASVSKQAFTGGMPKTFVLTAEDETWVKSTVGSIREELKRMLPDGTRFEETVLSIITRERHYAQWKNDGCPEDLFDIPPLSNETAEEAARAWQERSAPPSQFPFRLGTRPLSRVWARGFKSIDQLKAWKPRSTYQGLDEDIQRIVMDEEDDKAMGKEPSPEDAAVSAMLKTKLNWRALRHASHTQLRHFAALSEKRDIHILITAIKAEEQARAAALQAGTTSAEAADEESAQPGTPIAEDTPAPPDVSAHEEEQAAGQVKSEEQDSPAAQAVTDDVPTAAREQDLEMVQATGLTPDEPSVEGDQAIEGDAASNLVDADSTITAIHPTEENAPVNDPSLRMDVDASVGEPLPSDGQSAPASPAT